MKTSFIDWPVPPPHISQIYARRPETEIVEALHAPFVCCGHHHTASDFLFGASRVLALNIIATQKLIRRHIINPGWCALFEWDGESLNFLQHWPQIISAEVSTANARCGHGGELSAESGP